MLAIARRDKLIYFETFGHLDKAAGTPMRPDAIFNIASLTKPMTAVAALQPATMASTNKTFGGRNNKVRHGAKSYQQVCRIFFHSNASIEPERHDQGPRTEEFYNLMFLCCE